MKIGWVPPYLALDDKCHLFFYFFNDGFPKNDELRDLHGHDKNIFLDQQYEIEWNSLIDPVLMKIDYICTCIVKNPLKTLYLLYLIFYLHD